MLDEYTQQHIERIKAATTNKLGRKDVAQWITTNTFINGKNFSFLNHEYQQQILADDSAELVIKKSAQTGISEMSMRMALALIMVMPGSFRIGYTFPSAGFASGYAKTRLNPIISGSPALRAAMATGDLDSAEMKTFGEGKELYFKGAAVGNAAISTTLDLLIHDERSFSDPEIIGDYWSRVLHSDYKWRVSLSTPTHIGDQIDIAFQNSRRHWNFCQCTHCNHLFIPNYYENVWIPGWTKDLDEINASNLHTTRYQEAKFVCQKCHQETSLLPENRQWVCENPTENHRAAGYQVQPFDAPLIVTLPDLIDASTKYATKTKFRQFSLGQSATDSESGLTDADIDKVGVELMQTPFSYHQIGVDLGLYCHFMVGGVAHDGTLVVVHYERVALKDFRVRYAALAAQYNVTIKVSDIQPYSELIMSLSEVDKRLYAGRYVTRQGIEIYDLKQEEPDKENAIEGVREVSINRNALFDKLLSELRPGEGIEPRIKIAKRNDWALVKAHLTSMRRAQATLRNGEFTSVWTKPADGQDHYFHTLGYLWVAVQMRSIAYGSGMALLPTVSSFKVKEPVALPNGVRR